MYCTVEDLRAERTVGEDFDEERAIACIQDATDYIDTRLSQHYSTPFVTVPRFVRRLCIDFTMCFLLRASKVMIANEDELVGIKMLCEKAEADLQRIIEGRTQLNTTNKRGANSVHIYTGNSSYIYTES